MVCADFVGTDGQRASYAIATDDIEPLIARSLKFIQAHAMFLPRNTRRNLWRASLDGETLTFRADAVRQLARRRHERSYLLALAIQCDYQIWVLNCIVPPGRVDVDRAVANLDIPLTYSELRALPLLSDSRLQQARVPLADVAEALDSQAALRSGVGGGCPWHIDCLISERCRR